MPGYWIARAKVINSDGYKIYADLVPGIMKKYDAKVLVRGGDNQIMEGTTEFNRFVVIEFPTMELAISCFNSAEYQAAAKHRRDGSGEVNIVIADGI